MMSASSILFWFNNSGTNSRADWPENISQRFWCQRWCVLSLSLSLALSHSLSLSLQEGWRSGCIAAHITRRSGKMLRPLLVWGGKMRKASPKFPLKRSKRYQQSVKSRRCWCVCCVTETSQPDPVTTLSVHSVLSPTRAAEEAEPPPKSWSISLNIAYWIKLKVEVTIIHENVQDPN